MEVVHDSSDTTGEHGLPAGGFRGLLGRAGGSGLGLVCFKPLKKLLPPNSLNSAPCAPPAGEEALAAHPSGNSGLQVQFKAALLKCDYPA
jgi:hypothetical protein